MSIELVRDRVQPRALVLTVFYFRFLLPLSLLLQSLKDVGLLKRIRLV
jgi:hypothetical protein